ncbi:hypothetical protein TA3x_003935 [Tundrisphaera sp. TA3]|uniref:hypothetical protein n=1 Tax=Tundrisphaera sp. TA3 TaxID=3435775 RepID=UPI003EB756C6
MPGKPILVEQVVYGSFAFWDRGYAVLARSPGVRDEWLSDLLAACRRYGEAPRGAAPSPALFSLSLPSGPRAVVGVFPQGCDDRGRPGALAFHGLLIADRDYRRLGADPFAFAGALRGEWTAEAVALPGLTWPEPAPGPPPEPRAAEDPRAAKVAAALGRGRRVALESDAPIDALARDAWRLLPESARRRASVATWAFGNDNHFDLLAAPRLAGVALDGSYLLPGLIDDPDPLPEPADPARPVARRPWLAPASVAAGLILMAAIVFWPRGRDEAELVESRPVVGATPSPPDPAELARFEDGLRRLAERFAVPDPGDPAGLMARFAEQVRYRGPTLTDQEVARLAAESDPDRDRALAWHDQIGRLRDDRPWPEDFARLDPGRQIVAFAGSYHLDGKDQPIAGIPDALDEALSRPGPVVPTPLASRYPALSDYTRFLARLPRRKEGSRP